MNLDSYIIDNRIFNVKFACNLNKCKGACCTIEGTLGAPVLEEEITEIKKIISKVKKYLTAENLSILEREGFYVEYDNNYSLMNVNDNDCVFSFFENGIAKCAFQKAFLNNEIDFPKPMSCYLFPIRVSGQNRNTLRYEKYSECGPALKNGDELNVTIFEFLKEPLIRYFGENFYNSLKENIDHK